MYCAFVTSKSMKTLNSSWSDSILLWLAFSMIFKNRDIVSQSASLSFSTSFASNSPMERKPWTYALQMCSKPYSLNSAVFSPIRWFWWVPIRTQSLPRFPEDVDGEFSGATSLMIGKVNKYSESNRFALFFKKRILLPGRFCPSFIKGTNKIPLNVADNKTHIVYRIMILFF